MNEDELPMNFHLARRAQRMSPSIIREILNVPPAPTDATISYSPNLGLENAQLPRGRPLKAVFLESGERNTLFCLS
jgi:hypothetical protein